MHVKQVVIKNVRGFKSAELELSEGINIIVGPNNSGKSSLLKCIYELQQSTIELKEDDIRKGSGFFKILITLDNISPKDKKLFKYDDSSDFSISHNSQRILIHLGKTPAGTIVREQLLVDEMNGNDCVTVSESNIKINNTLSNQKPFCDFSRFSSMEDENMFIYPFLSKRKTDFYNSQGGRNDAFGVDHTLRNLPAKIQNLSNGTFPQSNEFKTHCEDILGCEFGKLPAKIGNQDGVGIFVTTTERIFIESMGEGTANILGLLAILHTQNDKLFLIEELENDIHPTALKKLLNVIIQKSKNNQFIITTHSHIVLKYLAAVPNSKIFYTDWNFATEDDMRIPETKISEVENSVESRFEILNKLGYDLLDFDLYKSYLIFEESSAEQLVKEFLLPQFVPGLQNKIKTIAANGVNNVEAQFYDFLRLFVFVHVSTPIYANKAWIIADGDDAGIQIIKDLRQKFQTWPEDHFKNLTQPCLENYYPERFLDKVETIKSELDKKKRQELKGKLIKSIIDWIKDDPEIAKKEMSISAKEIIDVLRNIDKELNGHLDK